MTKTNVIKMFYVMGVGLVSLPKNSVPEKKKKGTYKRGVGVENGED